MGGFARSTGIVCAVAAALLLSCRTNPPVEEKPAPRPLTWYWQHYPFMEHWGRVFTFESEFDWPAGYRRPDSATLSPYQYWTSFLPLWPKNHGVGSLRKGDVFAPEQIIRSIQLPWRTQQFTDAVIPLQLFAEYLNWSGRTSELTVIPRTGDTLRYSQWLESKPYYDARGGVHLKPSAPRQPAEMEFNRFIDLCAVNTSYLSLTRNCLPVDDEEVAPGDLFVGHDERGKQGRVFVVVCELRNRRGDKVYAIGTGCDFGCDFHIPLVGKGRRDPWVTTAEIRALAGEWPETGFYRLHQTVP